MTARKILTKLHPTLPKMISYLWISVVIALIEIGIFWLLNTPLAFHYTIAVTISFIIAVLLNWYASRAIVFRSGNKHMHHEFLLILFAAIMTLIIQLAVTTAAVEWAGLSALIGKILALGVSFFWNFWFRHQYIFNE